MKYIVALTIVLSAAFTAHAQARGTAFFKYSYTSGMNRVCVYDLLGSQYVYTIGALDMCPLTIRVG
jgi:hypothetical protein